MCVQIYNFDENKRQSLQITREKMVQHEIFMQRCLQLAEIGRGSVSPNPMVGSVIVKDGRIIGEGFHQKYGETHAEVNAINSVNDVELLKHSTLYVNLEPCSHWGKTPPCVDLIIQKQIPRVVIGAMDTHEKVCGQGILKLKKTGIEVLTGVLEQQCRELNHRFYTFHEKKRPYVILKWAQTKDGYIDIAPLLKPSSRGLWITNDLCRRVVHKWRAQEDSILVGTNTALNDNPSLTTRDWPGKNPLRLTIDNSLKLNDGTTLLDDSTETIVFSKTSKQYGNNTSYVDIEDSSPSSILAYLYSRNIQSIIIEGGSMLLQSFINDKMWDEARVFVGTSYFIEGVKAPLLNLRPKSSTIFDDVELLIHTPEK